MQYFRLIQDERTKEFLKLPKGSDAGKQERSSIYVTESKEFAFIDWIDKPKRIVSDRMKQLLALYEADLQWHSVILTAKEAKQQKLYWFLSLQERDVLSDKSESERMILSAGKLKRERVFGAAGHCIVHLDVAESLLRRAFSGLRFIPVEVDAD